MAQAVRLRAVHRLKALLGRALGALPPATARRIAGRPIVVDGEPLAPDVKLLLAAMGDDGALIAASPGELRRRQAIAAVLAAGARVEVTAVRELDVDGLPGRYYAARAAGAPLLVFVHGGGFVFGDLATHDRVCRMLCRHADVNVLAFEYRLAPDHPFPAAVEDTARAWRWARAHAAALGADPARVAIGGDSAGANLATVLAQHTAGTADAPACQLLIYPTVDHHGAYPSKRLFAERFLLTREAMAWYHEQYVETIGADPRDPRLTPILAGDLAGQPPALVITAGFDPLRDEGEAYAAALRRAGSVAITRRFGGLIHGFANLTGVSRSAHDAVVEIAALLRTMLAPALLSSRDARQDRGGDGRRPHHPLRR
jgi:acetyl esterase